LLVLPAKWFVLVGVLVVMPIKVRVMNSRPSQIPVRVKRAPWQQFLHY